VRRLEDLATSPPVTDPDTGRLVIPITGGAAPTAAVIRSLDTAGIDAADLVVRRPTLDDVFLTLTGAAATTDQPDPVAIAGGALSPPAR
jgi:ABC-2 type transport system ATP-binding protein